jgi:hypothetical protein
LEKETGSPEIFERARFAMPSCESPNVANHFVVFNSAVPRIVALRGVPFPSR